MLYSRKAVLGSNPSLSARSPDARRGGKCQYPKPLRPIPVHHGVEMRTNLELDDRLVSEVMRRYRLKTKREAVDLALKRLVDEPLDAPEALALERSGWEADLAELRQSRLVAPPEARGQIPLPPVAGDPTRSVSDHVIDHRLHERW
jgi:Arc/MetJ family transcription regulator